MKVVQNLGTYVLNFSTSILQSFWHNPSLFLCINISTFIQFVSATRKFGILILVVMAFRVGFCFNLLTTVSERVPKMVWLNWCQKDKPILAYQRRNLHKESTTQNSIKQFRQVSYQNKLITFLKQQPAANVQKNGNCREKFKGTASVAVHRLLESS